MPDLPLETQTCTRQDGVAKIPPDRAERVLLHHLCDLTQLLLCLFMVDTAYEAHPLGEGQVCPVYTFGSVDIIWEHHGLKLPGRGVVIDRIRDSSIPRLWTVRSTDHPIVGRVMMLLVNKAVVSHVVEAQDDLSQRIDDGVKCVVYCRSKLGWGNGWKI